LGAPYTIEEFHGASLAYGVNNSDMIVGRVAMGNRGVAYSYDFRNDTFTDLAPQGTTISWADSINAPWIRKRLRLLQNVY
jgi:hypothetical protein